MNKESGSIWLQSIGYTQEADQDDGSCHWAKPGWPHVMLTSWGEWASYCEETNSKWADNPKEALQDILLAREQQALARVQAAKQATLQYTAMLLHLDASSKEEPGSAEHERWLENHDFKIRSARWMSRQSWERSVIRLPEDKVILIRFENEEDSVSWRGYREKDGARNDLVHGSTPAEVVCKLLSAG